MALSARSIRRRSERERSRRLRRRALIGAAAVSGALAPAAHAATFNVDVPGDGPASVCGPGNCTLRDAIVEANSPSHPGLDHITFDPSLSTVTLTAGSIPVTEALSIEGPGQAQLAVDANDASRIFNVYTSVDVPVSISGLSLVDGKSPGAPTGPYFDGGAIVSDGADLTIEDSTISSSYATAKGAAISSSGDLAITGSTITDNVSLYKAGGIYSGGDLTITDSSITGNKTKKFHGGGVLAIAGSAGDDITITGSDITGNQTGTVSGLGQGGGIYSQGPLTITDSHINGNTAGGDGGGAHISVGGSATISDSTFNGNYAGNNGGGLALVTGSDDATVERSSISGNNATGDGGGLYARPFATGALAIESSTLAGNIAYGSAGGGGAEIFNDTTISNSTVHGNRVDAGRGAGVLATVNGGASLATSPRIENSTIAYNGPGGGIYEIVLGAGAGSVELSSTIVADSGGGDLTAEAVDPGSFTGGFNLIESPGVAILNPTPAGRTSSARIRSWPRSPSTVGLW